MKSVTVGAMLALTIVGGAAAAESSGNNQPLGRSIVARTELARPEALAALGDRQSVERRRLGAGSLGERGTMADVPRLVEALSDPDPLVRALSERSLWQVWSRSGDNDVDRLLAIGIEQMNARDGAAAVETFSRVIERRPDFAEGWNKRATVRYRMGEYRQSLADCDEVMKLNPFHFGALSGYGMIYLQLDQPGRALEYFEKALGVNPNLDSVREAAETLRKHLIQRGKNTL